MNSFQHPLHQFELTLEGVRADAFKRGLSLPNQKRDGIWLQRLQYNAPSTMLAVPPGWQRLDVLSPEPPSRKQEKSVFYWLHRALYSSGFLCKVLPGQTCTILLPSSHGGAWTLYQVDVGEGAQVTLVDDFSLESSESIPFRGVQVNIGRAAKVEWQGYQHHGSEVTAFDHKRFVLGEGSRLDYFHHVLGGGTTFEETLIELEGDHSEAFSQTVFFGHRTQQHEMRVNHMHVGRNTKSQMVSKGAVSGQSHGSFLGMIQMEPGCSGADGHLAEHNLLLSSGAKIDAFPGLEIGHHDVKAGHAAYMERVDEEKLFYAAARGIPEQEAIELIVEGFFWDAITKMKNLPLEERIFSDILKNLHITQ